MEKFELLKINNPNQKDIFEKVFNYISKMKFDKSLSNDDLIFFNDIIEEGRQRFNWSDEFIGITFCSFEFINDKSEYNLYARIDEQPIAGYTSNCRWGGMFACGALECSNGGCDDDGKLGCGFLFAQDCTGKCR